MTFTAYNAIFFALPRHVTLAIDLLTLTVSYFSSDFCALLLQNIVRSWKVNVGYGPSNVI